MKQTDPQFKLRLPPDLKKALDDRALEKGRTLTAEIVERLEQSFRRSGQGDDAVVADLARRLFMTELQLFDITNAARRLVLALDKDDQKAHDVALAHIKDRVEELSALGKHVAGKSLDMVRSIRNDMTEEEANRAFSEAFIESAINRVFEFPQATSEAKS